MNRREAIQRAGLVLGYAIAAPTIAGVLNGCKAKPELGFSPQFLKADQAAIVSAVAGIIIPKTDTPGAIEVGVPGFIDVLVKDCYKKEDQDNFLKGLSDFDAEAKTAYGDAFIDLDAEQQTEYVTKAHKTAVDADKAGELKDKPRPFILTMKELTIVGFFTSEPGATQVLQYEAVPGAYKGCIPLAEVGKTWAT